jgi:hypothetical protein
MKSILLTVAAAIMIVVSLSQCTAHRSSVYNSKMNDLRSQVQVGDNIYEAAKKIKGRYHYTTGPLDPTKRGKELWLHVNFGLQPTFAETMAYTAEIDLPFDDNKPISAIIKADAAGTITNIE